MIRIKQLELRIKPFKKLIFALFFILYSLYSLFFPISVSAANVNPNPNPDPDCIDPGGGISIGKCFGFGEFTSLGEVVSKIVPAMFSVATAVVVLYFLVGAFKYIQSRGNKEEVAAAQNIIIHAAIGFIILMFAFLILQFLLSSLFEIDKFKIIA